MNLDAGQWAVIVLSAVLILGYIVGYYRNRQRAEAIVRWLYQDLAAYGPVETGAPLRGMASGGRLIVKRAKGPFSRIEILYILEPRENLLFWLIGRLQKRRDMLVCFIDYRKRPGLRAEVGLRGDRSFKQVAEQLAGAEIRPLSGSSPLQMAFPARQPAEATARVETLCGRLTPALVQLTLQDSKPHLQLRLLLPPLMQASAADLLRTLASLARPQA